MMLRNSSAKTFVDDDGVEVFQGYDGFPGRVEVPDNARRRYEKCHFQNVEVVVHGDVEFVNTGIVDAIFELHEGARFVIRNTYAGPLQPAYFGIRSCGKAREIHIERVHVKHNTGLRLEAERLVFDHATVWLSGLPNGDRELQIECGILCVRRSNFTNARILSKFDVGSLDADGLRFENCFFASADVVPTASEGIEFVRCNQHDFIEESESEEDLSDDVDASDDAKEEGEERMEPQNTTQDLVLSSAKSGAQMAAVQRFVGAVVEEIVSALEKVGMPKKLARNELVRFLAAVAVVGIVVLVAGRGLFGVSRKKGEYLIAVVTASAAAIVTDKLIDMLPSLKEIKSLVAGFAEE